MTATVGEIATLAHGYTMGHIDRLSFDAARRSRSTVIDFRDKQETAWHAIVEMLYDTTERPTHFTLLNHASDAVDRECRQVLRSRGIRAGEPGVGEYDHKPKFLQYWLPVTGPMTDFTDRIVERDALPQVLGKLSPLEYEAIATLAAHGSQKDAAEALGITLGAFGLRLWQAREKVWRHWFEHETPPPKTRQSKDTCRYGHPKSQYAFVQTNGSFGCTICRRNRARRSAAKNRERWLNLDLDDD